MVGMAAEEDSMSRRFCSWIGPVACALSIVACAGSAPSTGPGAAPAAAPPPVAAVEAPAATTPAPAAVAPRLETVKVSVFPSMGHAGTFIGMKRGYFAEESL